MAGLHLGEVKKIGFNASVLVDGRDLHVQTEVLTREGIVIRTTILEGGVAKFAEKRPCPPEVSDLSAFVAVVESQHKQRVEQLRREGAKWLESI